MKALLIALSFMACFAVHGQKASPETLEKIETARIALISERLELTPEQAEKFWPIYREFGNKRKEISKD